MKFFWSISIVGWLFLQQNAMAAPEFMGLQEMAQGQSLTGANTLNDSLYVNPAGSAFTKTYSVEGDYFPALNGFGVSVVDTKTSTAAGALGYFRESFNGSADQFVQGIKVATAERLSNEWAFGIAAKAMWGPNIDGNSASLKDGDLGVLYNAKTLQLGFTVRNVLGGDALLNQQREWSIGGRINWEEALFFSISTVSTWSKFAPYQVGIGAEYVSPYYFSLKGGYRILTDGGLSYYSAGASLITPKFCLHYAAEIPAQGSQNTLQSLGATFLF
jgi:hypothetical protein